FSKTYPLELGVSELGGIVHYRITDEVSIGFLAVDHQVVCIEVEPVFVGEVGEVIHAHLQPYGNAPGELLIQYGLRLFGRRKPLVYHLDAQSARQFSENASRHRAVAESRGEIDL